MKMNPKNALFFQFGTADCAAQDIIVFPDATEARSKPDELLGRRFDMRSADFYSKPNWFLHEVEDLPFKPITAATAVEQIRGASKRCGVSFPFEEAAATVIDWSKPLQTRSGDKARLLGVLKTTEPEAYMVAADTGEGEEMLFQVRSDGTSEGGSHEGPFDIINVPPAQELDVWRVVYRASDGGTFLGTISLDESKARGVAADDNDAVGVVNIKWKQE